MAFEKEHRIRMYVENEDDTCLEILPSPDAPDFGITIRTPNEKSIDWFGKINICLSADECRELGKSMIEFADKFDEENA